MKFKKIHRYLYIVIALIVFVGTGVFFYRQHDKGLYHFTVYLEPGTETAPYSQTEFQSQKYVTKVGDYFRVLGAFTGVNSAVASEPGSITVIGDKSLLRRDTVVTDGFTAVKTGDITIRIKQRLPKSSWGYDSFSMPSLSENSMSRISLLKIIEGLFQYLFGSVTETSSLTLKITN